MYTATVQCVSASVCGVWISRRRVLLSVCRRLAAYHDTDNKREALLTVTLIRLGVRRVVTGTLSVTARRGARSSESQPRCLVLAQETVSS